MVNVVGTVNVFEAIRASARTVGLAFASSAAVFGDPLGHRAGLVADTSELLPESFYGVYKAANEGTARVYSREHGIGSICLRPFIVYGLGRDQGMTSDPTKAMLAAAAGVPFKIKFGGSVLLTYAPDCARAFIASARAAAGSGDAVSLNVPGRRIGIPALVDLIEHILPGSGRFITWDDKPLRVPSLLSGSALRDAVGDLPNAWLADGVRETIAGFQAALAAGLVTPALS
jgi:nucleoside-diphosphate-sugar epimerase